MQICVSKDKLQTLVTQAAPPLITILSYAYVGQSTEKEVGRSIPSSTYGYIDIRSVD